jgi:hypothetical protein
MTTIRETPNRLIIRSFSHRRRLIVGLTLLLFGLLVSFAVFLRLIQLRTLIADRLTELPRSAQSANVPSPGEVLVRLSYRGVRSVTRGPRPIVGLGFLSLIAGGFILARYRRGRVIAFDKTKRQVTLVESYRFYRPRITRYPFEAISAVRVERDRSFASKGDNVFTVQLEIDLSDPTRIESDFVYKKPVLLSRFRHSRAWAQDLVEKIKAVIDTKDRSKDVER